MADYQKVERYFKENNKYTKLSQWTSSNSVEMDNGNTLEDELVIKGTVYTSFSQIGIDVSTVNSIEEIGMALPAYSILFVQCDTALYGKGLTPSNYGNLIIEKTVNNDFLYFTWEVVGWGKPCVYKACYHKDYGFDGWSEVSIGYRFTSCGQLGLDATTITSLVDIINAMPNYSKAEIFGDASWYTKELVPTKYGSLEIRRDNSSSNTYLKWYVSGLSATAKGDFYTAKYHATDGLSDWVKVITETEFEELKKSVSDGKSAVASAITSMGVSTESDATFETMATNVSNISKNATAVASDILSGKTAYSGGSKITGSMTNNGAKTASLNCGGSYTIPAGYHNGSGKVTANSLASQITGSAVESKYKHTFKSLTDCPYQCQCGTAVYYNGKIYVHGAGSSGDTAKYIYSYDVYTNTWTKLADSPIKHQYPNTAVLVAGSIYYFGNWTGSTINLYRYNIAFNSWTNMAVAVPTGCAGATCIEQNGLIRCISSNFSGHNTDLYNYNTSNNTFTKSSESFTSSDGNEIAGAYSPCISHGKYFYVFCRSGSNCKKFSIADGLSALVNITMPGETYGGAVKIGNYVYIMCVLHTNRIYRMNLNDNTFTYFYATHFPYQSPLVSYGDEIFYFGSSADGQSNKATCLHTCASTATLY